jgi:hypothetical protein
VPLLIEAVISNIIHLLGGPMENVFDYEDIHQLIPAKSVVNSRSECDTTVSLGGHTKSDRRIKWR